MKKYKKDFSNKDFADCYIKRHKKIIEKFGYDYVKKLIEQSKLKKGTFSKSILWWNFEICQM